LWLPFTFSIVYEFTPDVNAIYQKQSGYAIEMLINGAGFGENADFVAPPFIGGEFIMTSAINADATSVMLSF